MKINSPSKPPQSRWGKILFGGLLGYLLVCLYIYSIQKELLYHPERFNREDQIKAAQQFHGKEFFDLKGEFCGWMIGDEQSPLHSQKTILILHGNEAPAVIRDYLSKPFRSNPLTESWPVLLFEYPGFGHREGAPEESIIVEKALQAVDSIQGPILLVGESLGTGVASYIAAKRPLKIEGLLLITPFNNMTTTASVHYPLLPISLILTERYPSDKLLQNYPGKVAFMIAEKDQIIPAWIGEKLYDSLQNPKQKWIIPNADHNSISHHPQEIWWQEAIEFLAKPS